MTHNVTMIDSAAVSFGLDLSRFRDDVDSSETNKQAAANTTQATTDGVRGTPTILVGKTGGNLVIVPADQVDATLARLTK